MNLKLLLFFSLIGIQLIAQERLQSYVDFHSSFTNKPFNSRTTPGYNVWERIDHQCGSKTSMEMLLFFGKESVKQSQGHLEALMNGNVRVVCMALSPIQTEVLRSKSLNNNNKKESISCLYGITGNEVFLRQQDRDYFADLVEQILYIERSQEQLHSFNGFENKYSIMEDKQKLEALLEDPNRIGIVLAVEGGHALGNSIYINGNITNTKEYEDLVLDNIARLKGLKPLVQNTDKYIHYPVLYLSLGKYFENGMTGHARFFNTAQEDLLTKDNSIDKGLTELGKEVIKSLIEDDLGRRILVDVSRMSLESRKWYYKYVDRMNIIGKPTPIVASHVGISGLSWDNPKYTAPDDEIKNNGEYLNHWKENLSQEDVQAIVNSKGLIGITLDENILAGNAFKAELAKTAAGTAQRRELFVKLIVANMLSAVSSVGSVEAWNCIAIGSDFDAMLNSMENYKTAEQFPDLARDIQTFFEKPSDVFNLLTATQIKKMMYGLTAQQISDKVTSLNALNFLRRNLNHGFQEELPEPSLTGNVEFKLKGYENAKVVSLAGDFNGWLSKKIIFGKEGKDWVCRINLKPGDYQYKFVVDDKWILDPANTIKKSDGNGNENSIVKIK